MIVENHPVHHSLHGLLSGGELAPMHAGRFQSAPEAHGWRVVLAVAIPARRGTHLPVFQSILELAVAILGGPCRCEISDQAAGAAVTTP